MKKIGLTILGITAGIIALASLGSLLALVFSALVAYAGFHYFRKSDSTVQKIFWGIVLLIGLGTAVSNIPAFFGIIAIVALMYVWNNWSSDKSRKKDNIITQSDDPFVNFERQWEEIIK